MSDFFVGGTMPVGHSIYINRVADTQLLRACQTKQFAYILTSRQCGKSSLMVMVADKLRQMGTQVATIDLTAIGQTSEADPWYLALIAEIEDKLGLMVDVLGWWREHQHLSVTQRLQRFLREVVLAQISAPIVIFIDEIDTMLNLTFKDDFFAALRAIYNSRAEHADYSRLTFILMGVATPDELIADEKRTPFNIGQRIDLEDFSLAECQPLQQKLVDKYGELGRNYFEQIYSWTQGHPYLTQKLSQVVYEATLAPTNGIEELVYQTFLKANPLENNLQFVQRSVAEGVLATEMLQEYDEVLKSNRWPDKNILAVMRLKLYGLVVSRAGYLQVRNRIYREVFDRTWVQKNLHELETVEVRQQLMATKEALGQKEAALKQTTVTLSELQTQMNQLQQQLNSYQTLYFKALPFVGLVALLLGYLWHLIMA